MSTWKRQQFRHLPFNSPTCKPMKHYVHLWVAQRRIRKSSSILSHESCWWSLSITGQIRDSYSLYCIPPMWKKVHAIYTTAENKLLGGEISNVTSFTGAMCSRDEMELLSSNRWEPWNWGRSTVTSSKLLPIYLVCRFFMLSRNI